MNRKNTRGIIYLIILGAIALFSYGCTVNVDQKPETVYEERVDINEKASEGLGEGRTTPQLRDLP